MVLEPEFVVADEPTSMLDASYSAKIFNIILGMRKRFGVTILFITHSLAAARYLCDRIAVIYRGHLMEVGTAEEVIHRPLHPYTQALIDALPRFGQPDALPVYDTLLETDRDNPDSVGCPFFPRCRLAHRTRCSREIPILEPVAPGRFVACLFPANGEAAGWEGAVTPAAPDEVERGLRAAGGTVVGIGVTAFPPIGAGRAPAGLSNRLSS